MTNFRLDLSNCKQPYVNIVLITRTISLILSFYYFVYMRKRLLHYMCVSMGETSVNINMSDLNISTLECSVVFLNSRKL